MARSNFSPSPSPGYSSHLSDPSDDSSSEISPRPDSPNQFVGPSLSRPGSPTQTDAPMQDEALGEDTMSCQWEECGRVFNHLPTLIEHIHNGKPFFNVIISMLFRRTYDMQTISVFINPTTLANGRHVPVEGLPKHLDLL